MHTLDQLRAGKLAGIKRLNLRCGLETFPEEIFDLADSLEILDLSGNRLGALPDDLPRLEKLQIVFCSDNQFTRLPEVLGQCPRLSMIGFKANAIEQVPATALPATLRWLTLTDNRIGRLPDDIGRCAALQKLMLAGNRLRELPASLADCRRLELLRIAANRLDALPDGLLALPRLAWLAYAGNPLETAAPSASDRSLTDLAWADLQIDQQLGEGASGVIHRARYRRGGGEQTLAVKLFKGAVTSDGLPEHEMAAWIAAGEHPNLIPVSGTLSGHPAGLKGLGMPLIDPDFANLAGPPSLASCTRDVYPADGPGSRFDLATVLGIARGIAAAAAHLHRRGILHGDLYAHNILHCGAGRALLGDFGAASFFAPGSAQGKALQRIEVRAFGCLLEELVARCEAAEGDRLALAGLKELANACLDESPEQRPGFAAIEAVLAGYEAGLRS